MSAPFVTTSRDTLAEVLARHRVNYHHRNVGPEPVTVANLRYTSCEGCDWLGGQRDEAGWEAHLSDALIASGVVVTVESLATNEALVEAVARSMASLEPGEEWPTNAALGGSLTGTRDIEYHSALHEQAVEAIAALAVALGAKP